MYPVSWLVDLLANQAAFSRYDGGIEPMQLIQPGGPYENISFTQFVRWNAGAIHYRVRISLSTSDLSLSNTCSYLCRFFPVTTSVSVHQVEHMSPGWFLAQREANQCIRLPRNPRWKPPQGQ
jgi:hypothetical protein